MTTCVVGVPRTPIRGTSSGHIRNAPNSRIHSANRANRNPESGARSGRSERLQEADSPVMNLLNSSRSRPSILSSIEKRLFVPRIDVKAKSTITDAKSMSSRGQSGSMGQTGVSEQRKSLERGGEFSVTSPKPRKTSLRFTPPERGTGEAHVHSRSSRKISGYEPARREARSGQTSVRKALFRSASCHCRENKPATWDVKTLQKPESQDVLGTTAEFASALMSAVADKVTTAEGCVAEPTFYQSISTPTSSPSHAHRNSHGTFEEVMHAPDDRVEADEMQEMQESLANVAESLQKAALVLRNLRLVKPASLPGAEAASQKNIKCLAGRCERSASVKLRTPALRKTSATKSGAGTMSKSPNSSLPRRSALSPTVPSCAIAAPITTHADHDLHVMDENGNILMEETVQRLVQANQSLRNAFNEASQRILVLEDDKSHLFDEAIFDIVNSVSSQRSEHTATEISFENDNHQFANANILSENKIPNAGRHTHFLAQECMGKELPGYQASGDCIRGIDDCNTHHGPHPILEYDKRHHLGDVTHTLRDHHRTAVGNPLFARSFMSNDNDVFIPTQPCERRLEF